MKNQQKTKNRKSRYRTPTAEVHRGSNVGKVYRGRTKYIDLETKPERNYVVVKEKQPYVEVAKLKSVKKEKDRALYEINKDKYGLEKRTGVDYQRFSRNRMSKKKLSLFDKDVFPEEKERFRLSNYDAHKAVVHTKKK